MKSLFVLVLLHAMSTHAQPSKTLYKTIGGKPVYDVPEMKVYMITAGMMIDADGSPKAYHKENHKALDYLANAGKPGNWWAIVTDNKKRTGQPVIQSATDPAPGYYISMTSLQDGAKAYTDPLRYVNSEAIPYIAIPPSFATDFKLGDIALVINTKNNKSAYAIVADIGPGNAFGEASIYLAGLLGIKNNPKNGGAASGIKYILIKNSGNRKVMTAEEINRVGGEKFPMQNVQALPG